MRVSVNQPNLAKALSITTRAVSSRTTMPVLSNVLLEAKGGQLRLAGTNREIGINCWIAAKVEDEGAITIPARLMSEFVNSLPPERIDMELTVRTQTMGLQCAKFNANIKGIDAFEFPVLPTMSALTTRPDGADNTWSPGAQATVSTTTLTEMIAQVVFAASTDENRPTLTGVEVTLQPDMVQMAATDGYRLSVRSATIEDGPEKQTVIVPAKSLATVAAIMDADAPISLLVTPNRNQVLFAGVAKDVLAVEVASELIDARFPDYRATIPKSYNTRTIVDTVALLKAVRVALLFARDNANRVQLSMLGDGDDGRLKIEAISAESGDHAGELVADVRGDEVQIMVNAKFMIDVLSQIDAPQIALETTTPARPMMIKLVGQPEFEHTIMPMAPSK